jgi:hypothetical protein
MSFLQFLLLVLCTSLPANPGAPSATAQDTDLDAALERLGEHPPPPVFGEAETKELRRLSSTIASRRAALFNPKTEPTDEQLEQASRELQPAFDRLRELKTQRRSWEAYQADPGGEWWRDAEPDIPELVAADTPEEVPVDLLNFHLTAKRLQVFEYAVANPNVSYRAKYGYSEATVAEALAIARALEPFEQGRIEVGGQAAVPGGVGSYRLRAGYLRGRALILATYMLLDESRDDEARDLWRQAIAVLHRVEVVFKVASSAKTELTALAQIPAVGPELLDRLRKRDPHKFIPLGWDSSTHRIGLAPGGFTESTTATETAQLLEEVCPWSPPVVALLEDLGQLQGLDLRVLRGPEIGVQSRNGIDFENPKKVWIGSIGPAAIPPNVRRDLGELRAGLVPDSERYLEWRNIRGAEELSIWVVSPRVRDMQASEFLSWVSKAITLYGGGAIAIVADIAGDVIGKAIENVSADNTPAQIGIGIGAESVPYEIVTGEGGKYELKREGYNPMAMLKGALLAVLGAVEKAEIEYLFDGLDPTSDTFDTRTNRSISYVGGWVPPIILRAMVVGWERTDEDEYPRMRLYTRYWVLDPAGLTGEGQAFDLEKQLVDQLPGAASLRAGDIKVSERIWEPLPWAKKPTGWGSRARTVNFQPMTQRIQIDVPEELEKEWRADCPEGQDLCIVLRHGPTIDRGVDVVPLGELFRFIDKGYARREGLLPRFHQCQLTASYDAHIYRADRRPGHVDRLTGLDEDGPFFDIDGPTAVELANFPLRLTSRKGAPVTGRIESEDDGLHVKLNYTYEGRTRREFDLEPAPTSAPLLPEVLVLQGPYRKPEEKVFNLAWCYERLKFAAAYVPAEVDTWYQLDVRVIGQGGNYDQSYRLGDFNRSVGGAAVFHGNIPVPIGRSEIHLSIVGADPSSAITEVIERQRSSDYDKVNLQSTQQYIDQRLESRARTDDEQDWLYEHCQLLSNKLSLVRSYQTLEQWGNARTLLHEIAQEWPDVRRVERESLRDDYEGRYTTYTDYLSNVAFHQGDVAAMGPNGANFLAKQWEWTEKTIAKYSDAARRYGELEEKYRQFIDDYISIGGGGEVLEHLLGRWRELRRLSDQACPEDAHRFETGGPGR